jgi:phosphatidylethanolamine/phosphatidyl-N-methylethanolamine N-methyltransferase
MNRPATRLAEMDADAVVRAYKRWTPVYDTLFGPILEAGIKQTTAAVNRCHGRLLEVGVGTGLALPRYKHTLKITGIDLSPEMLGKARQRAGREGLKNIEGLHEMDATALEFTDQSFDVAVAMYVLTVVPDPQAVMHEMARVTKPGGTVIVANHFSIDKGLRGALEKRLAGLSEFLGWRTEFPVETLLVSKLLKLEKTVPLKPFGLFSMLRFRRLP